MGISCHQLVIHFCFKSLMIRRSSLCDFSPSHLTGTCLRFRVGCVPTTVPWPLGKGMGSVLGRSHSRDGSVYTCERCGHSCNPPTPRWLFLQTWPPVGLLGDDRHSLPLEPWISFSCNSADFHCKDLKLNVCVHTRGRRLSLSVLSSRRSRAPPLCLTSAQPPPACPWVPSACLYGWFPGFFILIVPL